MDGDRGWRHTAWGLLVSMILVAETTAADRPAARVIVQDVLTMPGRPAMLEAHLVRDTLLTQSGIGGESVEFFVDGKKVGTAMTGGDGRALLEYVPRMRGNLAVKVRVADGSRVQSEEATGTLFSWERRRPILWVELASLQEDRKAPLPFPALPPAIVQAIPAQAVPMTDAAEELTRLSEFFFNIIYYVMRVGPLLDTTEVRHWLHEHRFPSGFVVSAGSSKLGDKIDELSAQGWDKMKAGVGRTQQFAEALADRRIPTVIVPEPDKGDFPRKTQRAKDWKQVRKILQG
jgi:hypothetical protein